MSKRVCLLILLSLTLALTSRAAYAESRAATEPQKERNGEYPSPDGALVARIRPIGKSGWEWSESRIEIRARSGRVLRYVSFASEDHEHGEGVSHAAWTPDSKFFVFSTSSSGGHQPWHGPAYFYARRQNRVLRLDDYIGVGPNLVFSVSSPDVLLINTYVQAPPEHAIDRYRPVQVRLGRLRVGVR